MAGFNALELQELKDKGIFEQIGEQGRVDGELLEKGGIEDRKLQELVDSGALIRLNAELRNKSEIQEMVGDQAMAQLKEELRGVGINEQTLQGLKTSGALAQIIEQGNVDDKLLKNRRSRRSLTSRISRFRSIRTFKS